VRKTNCLLFTAALVARTAALARRFISITAKQWPIISARECMEGARDGVVWRDEMSFGRTWLTVIQVELPAGARKWSRRGQWESDVFPDRYQLVTVQHNLP